MNRAWVVVFLAFALACEGEYAPTDAGPRMSADAGVAGASAAEVLHPFLLEMRPISNGAAELKFEIFAPEVADEPAGLAFNVAKADINVEARVRYAAPMLGGVAAAFIPYLRLDVEITNNDNGRKVRLELLPVVGVQGGLRYARNVALVEEIGSAQSHYTVELSIRRPARFGAVDTSPFSSGIAVDETLTDQLAGTFLGEQATIITSHFSLDDLRGADDETGGGTSRPPPAVGGYIPP